MENNGFNKINEIYKYSDNRDKLIKVISYVSKLISIYCKDKNKNIANSFFTLYVTTSSSRQVFNLFRSFFEPKIFVLISELKTQKKDSTKNNNYQIILNIIEQISTFFFFIFDNLYLFYKINFIKNKKGSLISLFTNFFHLIILIIKIINNLEKISELIKSKSSSTEKEFKIKLIKLLIILSGILSDLISVLNRLKIFKYIFKININETIICLTGIWSGLVSLYKAIFF